MSNFKFPLELAPHLSPEGLEKLSQLGPVRQTYLSDPALRWRNARLLWIFIGFFLLLGIWVIVGILSRKDSHRMYPRLLAKVEAGEIVTFDGLGLSKEGLHLFGRLLPWDEVEAVNAQRFLNIRQRNARPWSWWKRRQLLIPNLPVFMSLANHYLKTNQPPRDAP
jgi:hypothetical protein